MHAMRGWNRIPGMSRWEGSAMSEMSEVTSADFHRNGAGMPDRPQRVHGKFRDAVRWAVMLFTLQCSRRTQRRRTIVVWMILMLVCLSGCRIAGGTQGIRVSTKVEDIESIADSSKISTSISKTAESGETQGESSRSALIVCEAKGQVQQPGVYDLPEGSRVSDLIRMAGGISHSGSLDWVNQARKLSDGEVVFIPPSGIKKEEYEAMTIGGASASPESTSAAGEEKTSQIDINTATEDQLQTVPGIGPVTAKNIVDYRTQNGPFKTLEELKNVNRIGDKTYDKLKDYFMVSP